MISCIQCRSPLDTQTSANGISAPCAQCGIEHVSLGRLLRIADSGLLLGIWDTIQKVKDWEKSNPCPKCDHGTARVPFRFKNSEHALIACSYCYLVVLKQPTLQIFRESNRQYQERKHAETQTLIRLEKQRQFEQDLEIAKRTIESGIRKANWLLNETPLREIRVTVFVAVASTLMSLFTMLVPYMALDSFGARESSTALSSFTHLTSFHLALNLIFFCALSAPMEREWGSFRYALLLFAFVWVGNAVGRWITPFPNLASVGLSTAIGVLLGRSLMLRQPISFKIPVARLHYALNPRNAAFFFVLLEMRTVIPSSGGMQWFTLPQVLVAMVLSAAVSEWYRKRMMERSGEVRSVIVIPQSTSVSRASEKKRDIA